MASATVAAPVPVRPTAIDVDALVTSQPKQPRSSSPALSVASASSSTSANDKSHKPRTPARTPTRTPARTPSRKTTSAAQSPKAPGTPRPPSRTERRFVCSHPGCDKAYTKPSRLTEHELTHTGARPHVCAECGKSYLRSTHLTAHLRTHKNPDAKEFACTREGCDKKFWTATHLRRHEELHDASEEHKCAACGLVFPKSHFLREHIAATHGMTEPKPFVCTHDGCGQAFAVRQQLKTHEKIHDPTRYTCSHPDHGEEMPTFPVWSALQTHIRDAHPPACPYPECGGRVFKNATRLRDHLKVHEQRDVDLAMQPGSDSDIPPVIAEGLTRRPRRKRRRSEMEAVPSTPKNEDKTNDNNDDENNEDHDNDDDAADPSYVSVPPTSPGPARKLMRILTGETGKDWACGHPGCGKTYKSKFARDEHAQAVHTRARHKCDKCSRSYRRPASLKRHLAEGWCGGNSPRPRTPKTPKTPDEGAMLTGGASLPGGSQHRRWGCPFVYAEGEGGMCGHRFHRVYDVRRHLAAAHDVKIDDMGAREMLLADGQTGDEY